MSDLPAFLQKQQAHARSVLPEELETLGKYASRYYLDGRGTLTEAVFEAVKEAALSPEHVKRVVEFANVDAFLQEFKKEGQYKVIEFKGGPADFGDIMRDLNDGGTKISTAKYASDYSQAPAHFTELEAVNQAKLPTDTLLDTLFKTARTDIPYADPYRDIYDAHTKLSAAKESLASDVSALEADSVYALQDTYKHVKQASLNGFSLSDVSRVFTTVAINPLFAISALSYCADSMKKEGMLADADIEASLQKTASTAVVNTEHPLAKSFFNYCEITEKLAHTRAALTELFKVQ